MDILLHLFRIFLPSILLERVYSARCPAQAVDRDKPRKENVNQGNASS